MKKPSLLLLALAAALPLGALAQKNVVQPGDPIFASSANSPGTEGVANAIDGKTTKYLNFDSGRNGTQIGTFSPSGFAVTPSAGLTRVTGMTIQSANDAQERDPDVVLLEGSNDTITNYSGGTWTTITTISNIAAGFTSRFQTQTFTFDNFKPYKSYRWTVLLVRTTPNGCCMQVAEVGLLGSVVPDDVTQPGDPIYASSANSPGTEGVANAIDNKTTKYLNFDSGRNGTQIGTFSPSGFAVTPSIGRSLVVGIAMQSANDAQERDPDVILLEGSNDTITNYSGGNWTTITTISNIAAGFTSRFQTQTFLFDNVQPYKSYRWTALMVRTTPNGCCMQIAEVSLLGGSAPQDITQPGDPIIASSANSPGTEGVANAIDNKTTKYLNFDSGRNGTQIGTFSPSGFVVTPGIGAANVIGMTIQSANDAQERDPDVVLLEGSNDAITNFNAGTWTAITTISNIAAGFTNRFQTQEFYFPNNKSYTSYRWTVLRVRTTPNGCCMQVAEVELLAAINVAPASARFTAQPEDALVLAGQPATFYAYLNGPWPVQWLKNGVSIPGATQTSYTTDPVTAANATNVYQLQILGREASTPVKAIVFTPASATSIGVNFIGSGANGAPTDVNTNLVIGLFPQAYWNNGAGGSGDFPDANGNPTLDSNGKSSAITFHWQATGTWGAGTGVIEPTDRLLNGLTTANPTTPAVYTFSNVPNGSHSVVVYTVAPPLQFLSHNVEVMGATSQTNYIRSMNSDEYNAAPGWYRGSSTNPAARSVASYVLFEKVAPSPDGTITVQIEELAAGRTDRDSGANAIQLILNAPLVGAPPAITVSPIATVVTNGGAAVLTVTATGQNLTYQWRKNGKPLVNGGNISGATTATLVINPFTDADTAVYSVAVLNPAGSALSGGVSVQTSKFDIKDQLAAYFKLDSTSGTTAINSVSGGASGTVNGTATWKTGKIGGSLALDGNSYVIVTNYPKATKYLAGSAWVNVDPGTGTSVSFVRNAQQGLAVGGANTGQFDFGIIIDNNDGSLHLAIQISAGPNLITVRDPAAFAVGTWENVSFSVDGAQVHLYHNGVEVATADNSATFVTPVVQYLTIGARLWVNANNGNAIELDPTNPNALIGQIDDVAVWNRSISPTEANLIYTAGNSAKAVDTVVVPVTQVVVPTTPSLSVSKSSSGVVTISWPSTATGYALQSSTTAKAGSWTAVAGVTGSSYSVTPSGATFTFYRLAK